MKTRHLLEWAMIGVVMMFVFVWMAHKEAKAEPYDQENYGPGWVNPNDPQKFYHQRDDWGYSQPQPVYRRSEPYYYGPVEQQPEIIIYRDGRRFTTH